MSLLRGFWLRGISKDLEILSEFGFIRLMDFLDFINPKNP
jgi:hypothetical protein